MIFCYRFIEDAPWASANEYGLIAALLAVVIIGAATTLDAMPSSKFTSSATTCSRPRWRPCADS